MQAILQLCSGKSVTYGMSWRRDVRREG
jgi:hypothetical protein